MADDGADDPGENRGGHRAAGGSDDLAGDGAEDAGHDRVRADVRAVYDGIAEHFARTREHPWPAVARFVERSPRCAVALDVGCGNGRHAGLLAGRAARVVGVDASRALLGVARERAGERGYGLSPVQGDALALPVRTGRVDLALYVATVHHLPDRRARVRSLDELARVLRPGGRALVSAWSTTHDRFDRAAGEPGFDTTVDWTLPDGERVPRFYHIYAPGEFRDDVVSSDLRVERVFVEAGNCFAVVRGADDRS